MEPYYFDGDGLNEVPADATEAYEDGFLDGWASCLSKIAENMADGPALKKLIAPAMTSVPAKLLRYYEETQERKRELDKEKDALDKICL